MAKESQRARQTPEKKAFERPDFRVLGSVTEITRGPNKGAIDGIFGGIGGFAT